MDNKREEIVKYHLSMGQEQERHFVLAESVHPQSIQCTSGLMDLCFVDIFSQALHITIRSSLTLLMRSFISAGGNSLFLHPSYTLLRFIA